MLHAARHLFTNHSKASIELSACAFMDRSTSERSEHRVLFSAERQKARDCAVQFIRIGTGRNRECLIELTNLSKDFSTHQQLALASRVFFWQQALEGNPPNFHWVEK